MKQLTTDLCVIGAGSGGLSVAAGAVQMGARVILIEAGEMGGDCLNAGCVPSKSLIAAAHHAHAMTTGAAFGIRPAQPDVDFAAIRDHIAQVIAGIAPIDSQERFESLGVTVLREPARFASPTEVECGEFRITARRFVIATGSRPLVPPITGLDQVPYLTNETIFALEARPDHLLILGGGPIGMEIAQAHRRLGTQVTVVEAQKALGREDPEIAGIAIDALRLDGVIIREGAEVIGAAADGGTVSLTLKGGEVIHGSHLLVAVGRKVSVENLRLDLAQIQHDKRGVIVGPNLRSVSNRRVYAVGDAAGGPQFTHVAGAHAGIVIRQALFALPARFATHAIPRVTYTDPELAHVGLTEAEARAAHGAKVEVIRQEFARNDRAQTARTTTGMLKLIVHRGRPVGVSIVGPHAGELIGLWTLAISARVRLSAIAGMIAPYPTLGEISKRAAGAYFSPRLFANPWVGRVVRAVQRLIP